MTMFRPALVLLLCLLNVASRSLFETFDATPNPADDPKRTPSPPITRPRGGDRWNTLEVQTVKWDTTGMNVTGLVGTLLLGYVMPNTTKYVWNDQPLAQKFLMSDEAVNIILPDVPTGERYFIILLGDMNNTSPLFTIFSNTDEGLASTTPPASLPPQTMVTQSATITDTNVVSTITGQSTTSDQSATSSSAAASPQKTSASNGSLASSVATLEGVCMSLFTAVALAIAHML